jgi:Neprosin
MSRKPLSNPHPRRRAGKFQTKTKKSQPNYRAFEREIRNYFERRHKHLDIVATTRTRSGQILDWVPIESQLKSKAKIAQPPPDRELVLPRGRRVGKLAKFELERPGAERGPPGTIPILRKDLSRIRIVRSLDDYLSKHGISIRHVKLDNGFYLLMPDIAGNHHYTLTSQNITCFGAEGNISAFDPYTGSSTDFSLMQVGLANDDTGQRQTVEAGWQEYQQEYGDWAPHFFVFYTTNGYSENGDNKGGYNQDVDGWIQYDNTIYPGATSSPNSTPGGAQYILSLKYQLFNDNWWLRCNGRWIGYYPARLFMGNQSVFSTLGDHASTVGFWGEIGDVNEPTKTQMGSGYWAEDGWTYAAYQSNLLVQTDRGGGMSDYDGGAGWTSDPTLWDIITHMKSGSNWGSYLDGRAGK